MVRTLHTQTYLASVFSLATYCLAVWRLTPHDLRNLRNVMCFEGKSRAESFVFANFVLFLQMCFVLSLQFCFIFLQFCFIFLFCLTPEVLEHSNFCLLAFCLPVHPEVLTNRWMPREELRGNIDLTTEHFLSLWIMALRPGRLGVRQYPHELYCRCISDVLSNFVTAFCRRLIWNNLLHDKKF